MALNFTVSYTFSPSTTISSSQVNTNTSDVANVFTGLEAETKTLAKLKMDADPTLALEVATKQYVDHLMNYRRPVLQFNSSTVVNIETGLDGTSGDCTILFPDGNLRTDTASARIQCNLAQVAALSGSWQSGLRTGSVATNTWYAIYAVKTTDNTSHWVAVADTVLPLQANFATLNSNFGSSGWVYLGLIRNGDNSGTTNAILSFSQSGCRTMFRNSCTAVSTGSNGAGTLIRNVTSAANATYTYAAGTGTTQIPNNISLGFVIGNINPGSANTNGTLASASTPVNYQMANFASSMVISTWMPIIDSAFMSCAAGSNFNIYLAGFDDGVLGVGSNPVL